jgi:hypothetical protein
VYTCVYMLTEYALVCAREPVGLSRSRSRVIYVLVLFSRSLLCSLLSPLSSLLCLLLAISRHVRTKHSSLKKCIESALFCSPGSGGDAPEPRRTQDTPAEQHTHTDLSPRGANAALSAPSPPAVTGSHLLGALLTPVGLFSWVGFESHPLHRELLLPASSHATERNFRVLSLLLHSAGIVQVSRDSLVLGALCILNVRE